MDSCRPTADIDRQLAVGLGGVSHRTVYCAGGEDAGIVDGDLEALEAFNDCLDQPFNTYAGTIRRSAETEASPRGVNSSVLS